MSELTPLALGVHGWFSPHLAHGHTNVGVVVDADGITVVDATACPRHAAPLAEALAGLDMPVRRLVLTSSHMEYAGGSTAFPLAAVYGSRQVSAHLDQPPPAAATLRRLLPDIAADLDDELGTRRVTHTVTEAAYISGAAAVLPMRGELNENLVVTVPGAGVVFAGALGAFGLTPLCFDGDPEAWAETLDVVLEMGDVIVPGHGSVGGAAEVRELQGYLRACVRAAGDPDAVAPGPWDAWPGRDLDEINVERAALLARGDPSPPPSMLRRLGLA